MRVFSETLMPVFAAKLLSADCVTATPRKLMFTDVPFNSPAGTPVSLRNARKILIDNEEDTKEARTICNSAR